jgi:hypothetical protein
MDTRSTALDWWRLPAAFAASVVLALALSSIGAPVWISVLVGGLAGTRVAAPLLHGVHGR